MIWPGSWRSFRSPDDDTSVADTATAVARLRSKSGPAFDEAYLRHEVAFHQAVIDAVTGTLLPAAHDAELRKLIQTVLPGLEHHLAATKAVARKLGVH